MIARSLALLAAASLSVSATRPLPAEQARQAATAARVTITRDNWGIAHIHGRSDADAVFGMIYAQAEDDFPRIERNYLTALGRTAEVDGEAALWTDLRQRLYIDPADLRRQYATCPPWLKALMVAWADGLNYYLRTHPDVHPQVLTKFEPWMALSFSEGSIGGDIESIDPKGIEGFYGTRRVAMLSAVDRRHYIEPTGSNGIAIAPANTKAGHALLLINPHTSFYFRSEAKVESDQGLNAYGAATWGQFFIYQGFNDRAGWMHTSSGVDNIDEFLETVETRGGKPFYKYGSQWRPLATRTITLSYRTADGNLKQRSFTGYATHHGPITRMAGDKWVATALMNRPVAALEQSFLRTKAHDLAGFLKVAELKANSSNDTLFADAKGEIAYLHPQFVPIRDARFDYLKPVDGSNPATDWKGLHSLASLPSVLNPRIGWAMNTNNWPWTAAGPDSAKRGDYPRYMDKAGENPRGLHALRVLTGRHDFTIDALRDAAFDSYLPAFEKLVPALVAAWQALPDGNARKEALRAPVSALGSWDLRWSASSVPTSLAVYTGEALWAATASAPMTELEIELGGMAHYDRMIAAPAEVKIAALQTAVDRLTADFGSWQTPWGEINRFQRNDGAIVQRFDDAKPSIPVPFTSAQWGSLASFGVRHYPGVKRLYGTSGNSFVAIVEFGPRVEARAVSAGGESGDPASPHFRDQATRYAAGDLRPVYFHADELKRHVARVYRPGDAR